MHRQDGYVGKPRLARVLSIVRGKPSSLHPAGWGNRSGAVVTPDVGQAKPLPCNLYQVSSLIYLDFLKLLIPLFYPIHFISHHWSSVASNQLQTVPKVYLALYFLTQFIAFKYWVRFRADIRQACCNVPLAFFSSSLSSVLAVKCCCFYLCSLWSDKITSSFLGFYFSSTSKLIYMDCCNVITSTKLCNQLTPSNMFSPRIYPKFSRLYLSKCWNRLPRQGMVFFWREDQETSRLLRMRVLTGTKGRNTVICGNSHL